MELVDIREMMRFLGIVGKPVTQYRSDPTATCSYEVWLESYARQLRRRCEEKLVADYHANLGKNLFKQQFPSFQEFGHQ